MALLTEFSFFSMKEGERGARKTSASKDPRLVEILETIKMICLGCQLCLTKQGYTGINSCISGCFGFFFFIIYASFTKMEHLMCFSRYMMCFFFFFYHVILPEL